MLHVRGQACGPPLEPGLDVTVHLHPDRAAGEAFLVHALARDGVGRPLLETGTVSGDPAVHAGADRWQWEHDAFGGAYDDSPGAQRPKYGSLNHRRRPAGGSVRFGSSHLRLAPHVLARTTFCSSGGSTDPTTLGTVEHMLPSVLADAADLDVLDDYVEAHVHGALRLNRDIAALVLDPSFRGTAVEDAAGSLPFPVEWHHGFVLSVDELAEHETYRGAEVVALGRAVAQGDVLDARIIGDAVRADGHDPLILERLWHCTARFGRPA
ncbi:uncharacterized protein DUF3626 [Sanguibacter antarcticus]|uniref:Uncharacterized protein DUF3626 n=2 Tax=Sanguibacter antarcticus TaxID=372484 RepID=A0A2A9E6K1_9MICO|nr:uncharacterized protein DUF3626 [Sanguibacter antarcticus]